MYKLFRNKFLLAFGLLGGILLGGTLGYHYLLGLSLLDALYMTVITLATVGYRELGEPSSASKLFTIVLILSSVFIFAYAISVITEYVLSKNTLESLKYRRMKKQIDQLRDHVIICGFGRNGMEAAAKLAQYGRQFVVIEKEPAATTADQEQLFVLKGDATDEHILEEAGIRRASYLISSLPSDADNLFVVLTARQINKNLHIITRASMESSRRKLKLAGANKVVMPDKLGGEHMAAMVVMPDLTEFLDHLSADNKETVNLEEILVDKLPDHYCGRSIADLQLRRMSGCTVIGYKGKGEAYQVNPEPSTVLESGARILVLGRPEQIRKLNEYLFG